MLICFYFSLYLNSFLDNACNIIDAHVKVNTKINYLYSKSKKQCIFSLKVGLIFSGF